MNKASLLGRRQKVKHLRSKNKHYKKVLCSLGLSLMMASTGTLGTYAYFTTKAELNAPSNIILESGSVQAEYSKAVNIDGLAPGKSKSDNFNITNTGTLKQSLALSFELLKDNEFSNSELSALEYSLNFVDKSSENTKQIKAIEAINLSDYISNKKSISLTYTDGTPVILNSNSNLECTVSIKCKDNIPESASGKIAKFNLKLTSTQLTTN